MIPVVRGIVMTDERGPDPIAVLWSPADSLDGKDMRLYYPYPNPFHGRCSIRYQLLKNMHVKMWIVSAKLKSNSLYKFSGQDTVRVLVDAMQAAGTHQVMWDCKTEKREEVPNSFYRIYLQSQSELLWTDCLVLDFSKPIPDDIEAFLKSNGLEIE
jgi:hypothetical protein